MFSVFFLISIMVLWISSFCTELETKKGKISWSVGTSRGGREYYYFLGVPYAKPPVGSLRLKNPEEHIGWEGVLHTPNKISPCIQKNWYDLRPKNKIRGNEDCLYLNIYTPNLGGENKLPVMVYIHGGGFRFGNPGPVNGPAFFMDEDVIIVTVQYRLGALGFLSTEDSVIPGNYGLKDQAMALKWIKDNIDDYGGDTDCIVAFGESAGGASVHYLLTSPLSKDMLRGGISQSGVIDSLWAFCPPGRAKLIAKQVLKNLGCNYSSAALECLQALPAKQLIDTERDFIKWDIDPLVVFQPVIEDQNEGAFMTVDPRTVKVTFPWITGLTNGEGIMKSSSLINQGKSVLNYFIDNIDTVIPAMLFLDSQTPEIEKFLITVKNRYFRNLSDKKIILKELEKLYSDVLFAYPMKRALERHIGPKYAYYFSHRAQHSIVDLKGEHKLNSSKASHADDLLSLFDLSSVFPGEVKPEDEQFSKRLVSLWVNFTRSLSLNDGNFEKLWTKYSKNKMLHLRTVEWKMEEIQLDYIVDFWTKAFGQLQPLILRDEL